MSTMASNNSSSSSLIVIENFINGEFLHSEPGSQFESHNPATGEVNALIPDAGPDVVHEAVVAAKQAFQTWSKTPIQTRVSILNRIADLIDEHCEELARLESQDQGKTFQQSLTIDIPRSVHNFRHFANSLTYQLDSSIVEPESGIVNYTTRQPVGVVGIITPWNLPLYLLTFKLAPAIAFGNTVVAKPSELTSVTAFKLCDLLNQAGLPKGVINIVFGYGNKAGEAIVTHPDINLISFTGSTQTGRHIALQTAPHFKRLSLEMGGKNAAIVFEDADLEADMIKIGRSAYFNSGQICLASSRILVHESIYENFVDRFIYLSQKVKIGDPFDPNTNLGPLVSKQHLEKVQRYITLGRKTGKVTYIDPPDDVPKGGFFTGLAIITDVSPESECMQEEIFGPVLCIVKFATEEEAIRIANQSRFGLSATVWTESVNRMHRVAAQLDVGTVWGNCWLVRNLNMPFGGMKQSGIGREGTADSRDFYTNKKTTCIYTKK